MMVSSLEEKRDIGESIQYQFPTRFPQDCFRMIFQNELSSYFIKLMILKSPLTLVLLSAMTLFVACSAKDKDPKPTTKSNTAYRTPTVRAPALRNPSLNLPSSGSRSLKTSYSSVKTNLPYIAMTFDDGPHPQNTPRLLNMLRERNIKATFYVTGRNVKLYPQLTRRIVAEGHEIGNHTWGHPNLQKMGNAQVRSELDRTRDIIVATTGVQPRTMRPPYGALSQSQRAWIFKDYGYPTILWSVDPEDWKKPGPSVVTSRIVNNTRNGGIVLAHDLHKSTIDAMPGSLDGLLRKGFKFVTVSQLLALSSPASSAP